MVLAPATLLKRRYRIVRVLAAGGMGVVYEAADEALFNRRVAVKEIVVTANDVAARNHAVRRFTREARLLAEVRHPGIPHIYDHFHEGGLAYYLVMEFVVGRTLAETLPRAPFPDVDRALGWLHQIAEILRHLHARSPAIVFRDLKPANVMITESDQVKLIDFGIAWTAAAQPTQGLGTPGFAPPEQYARGECDPSMDMYALGATAYRILGGQDPPESVSRAFSAAVLTPLDHLHAAVPPDLARLVHDMLEILPRNRPSSMERVLEALDGLAAPRQKVAVAGDASSAVPQDGPSPMGPLTATVLIADDDPSIRRLVQSTLESAGYHVIEASNGLAAVQLVQERRPDLVILDIEMPGMGGTDACRVIRQSYDTPIIMLTALASETDRVVGLELGADDYVTKPFSLRELLARVRALLRRTR